MSVRQDTFGSDSSVDISGVGGADDGKKKQQKSQRQFPSKIAPPSLGGKKVGVFSTRTPHRPNPIGFSLCKLDKVVIHRVKSSGGGKNKKNGNKGASFSLLLSGLDIVDGTPILDIKPYVPHYDCVGYDPSAVKGIVSELEGEQPTEAGTSVAEKATTSQRTNPLEDVRVPFWVDSGLQKRRNVTFLPEVDSFLRDLANNASQPSLNDLQFYGPHSPWRDSPAQTVEHLKSCIYELLGVDVRSAWQTKKAREGKSQAERSSRVKEWKDGSTESGSSDVLDEEDEQKEGSNNNGSNNPLCTQQIDNLLVQYTIEEPGSALHTGAVSLVDERSQGSGAEDIVVVHRISFINK